MSAVDPTAPEPESPAEATDPATCRLLDELAANATVAPVTRLVDGWLAKAAPGLPFRRANAVLPALAAGDDTRSATRALDVLDAWYRSLGQRLLVQVPTTDPALDDLLASRGLAVEAPVDILVADVAPVAEAGSRTAERVALAAGERSADVPTIEVDVGVDEHWAERHGALRRDESGRARTEGYGRMLTVLGPDVLAATAVAGDDTVGVAFAVLERGWAGVFGMATAENWRRTGMGGALLGALATTVHQRGAHHLYLQVETDNDGAQALYRGLGFRRSHGYHYRVSPDR